MSEDSTDSISQDELGALSFLVKQAELALAAQNGMVQYLSQKYGIQYPDQLLASGQIVRAPKQPPVPVPA